jgi:protease I
MKLTGRRVALIATDEFEDAELIEPLEAARQAGADVTIVSNHRGEIIGENGTEITVDKTVDDVVADEFDALIIPGGVKNPDVMRTDLKAVHFVRNFFDQHKPVAAICHGLWLLDEADVIRGRTLTSWPSLRRDIENAGGTWVDEEVVVDHGLVTSRKPADLKAFCSRLIEEFSEGKHLLQVA